jgi:cytoskeletal protein RodZ
MGGSRFLYVIVAIVIVVGLAWYFGLFGGTHTATTPTTPPATTAPPATTTPPADGSTTTPPATGNTTAPSGNTNN